VADRHRRGHPQLVQDRNELQSVPALPGGQAHHQRLAALLAGKVQLRAEPAPRSTQGVIGGLIVDPTRWLPLRGTVAAGAGRMLMRPGRGRVRADIPGNQPGRVRRGLQPADHRGPGPIPLPLPEQSIDPLPGPVRTKTAGSGRCAESEAAAIVTKVTVGQYVKLQVWTRLFVVGAVLGGLSALDPSGSRWLRG
jgi:hypothetical protein